MSKYGSAALRAVQICRVEKKSAEDAWTIAMKEFFPSSPSSQAKTCPRGAFLGLCEAGTVKGVPSGNYCRSRLNKSYALKAHSLLQNKQVTETIAPSDLWQRVMGNVQKTPNGQMDVVLALWKNHCLKNAPQ